jgi:hypothetical protein
MNSHHICMFLFQLQINHMVKALACTFRSLDVDHLRFTLSTRHFLAIVIKKFNKFLSIQFNL